MHFCGFLSYVGIKSLSATFLGPKPKWSHSPGTGQECSILDLQHTKEVAAPDLTLHYRIPRQGTAPSSFQIKAPGEMVAWSCHIANENWWQMGCGCTTSSAYSEGNQLLIRNGGWCCFFLTMASVMVSRHHTSHDRKTKALNKKVLLLRTN